MTTRLLLAATLSIISAASGASARQSASPVPEAKIDAVFARWTAETPGCAVGVSKGGKPIVQKAYGMADLEHDAPNRADTIFEAGSVSKQFTAAAVNCFDTEPASKMVSARFGASCSRSAIPYAF